jgi:hypothetical protein
MSAVARHLGKKSVTIGNDPFLTHYTGDFFYSYTSLVTFDEPNYVSSHLIRDPRDMVVSAYYYHQWCKEEWCITFNPEFGMTYQEKLKSFPKEEGMLFEMTHLTKTILGIIDQWNYFDSRCLEMKYEDLISDSDKGFSALFKHWGVPPEEMDVCLEAARRFHMTQQTGRKVGDVQFGSHMRSGKPGQWKDEFSSAHKEYFKSNFGGLLVKLGYEKNDNW